jgi:hypothetical protein
MMLGSPVVVGPVSPSVEGHIYRACIKLDVADRDDLAKIVWHNLPS